MVVTLARQTTTPCTTVLPCLDADGDLCTYEIDIEWQWCSHFYESNVGAGWDPVEYQQANGMNELAFAAIANLAQSFLNNRLTGFGEQSSRVDGTSGTWIVPVDEGVG